MHYVARLAVSTNMVRPNGWNSRGERLVGHVPMGHWKTMTFIAGFRQTGIVAPMVIKGAMNGEAFLAYIEQCLVPTLKRRDVVVIDNVPFHKASGVKGYSDVSGRTFGRSIPLNVWAISSSRAMNHHDRDVL
jgi:DDE superfamily endonuclease